MMSKRFCWIQEDCRIVACESSLAAGASIETEPSGEGAGLLVRVEVRRSAESAAGCLLHGHTEVTEAWIVSQKRVMASAGDGIVRKQVACEHGKPKNQCTECSSTSTCPHGRIKSECQQCRGRICPHGRIKYSCKQCGGSRFCTHGRNKSQCKECGGSNICVHSRRKSYCKECRGSAICSHGRVKSWCKECGGSAICSHGRAKRTCKECGSGDSAILSTALNEFRAAQRGESSGPS